ncbi:MAG: class I SAM-dependent methyltransferase, partial [Candidatus Sulfotelmatobacter sp.]
LAPSGRPIKRLLRRLAFSPKSFQKIYGKSILAEIEICTFCSFIQTKIPFSDDAIARLYADYRSDSYNQERIRYEPEYASIASQVGSSNQEIQNRTVGLTRWLTGKFSIESNFSMLDYGGADGKFLPNVPGEKYVFDISDIAPAQGIVRIADESGLSSYSYVQLAHVLEHVTHPLALTRKAASFVKQSGYLYIEVPQELSNEMMTRLANGEKTIRVDIHEHINRYSAQSVAELVRSAGLSLAAIESQVVDFGWIRGTVVRALARKG